MASEHKHKAEKDSNTNKSSSFWKFFGFKNFSQFKKQLRTVWPLVAIAAMLITIPVVLFLAQQRQEIRQRAAYASPTPVTKYACSAANGCYVSATGPYTTFNSCALNCASEPDPSPSPSPVTKYACSPANGCYVSTTGPYTTFNSCALNCASEPDPSPSPSPVIKYACSPTNGCFVSATGAYTTFNSCALNCASEPDPSPSPLKYACSPTNGCFVSATGPYTTFNSCALNCASEPDPSPTPRPSSSTFCSNLGTTCTIDQQCCSGVCHDTLGKCTRTAACSTTGTTCTISQQCCFDNCNSGYCGARPSPRPSASASARPRPSASASARPRPSASASARPRPSASASARPRPSASASVRPSPSGGTNSPYCQFVSPDTSTIALNSTRNFTVNGGDVDGNMNKLEMWFAPTVSPNGQWAQMTPADTTSPFEMVRGLACTPEMAGNSYYVICNGYDATNRNCTGNPQNTSPYYEYDCGPNDMVTVSCATAAATPTPSPIEYTIDFLKNLIKHYIDEMMSIDFGPSPYDINQDGKSNFLDAGYVIKVLRGGSTSTPTPEPSFSPGPSTYEDDLQVVSLSLVDRVSGNVVRTLSDSQINDIEATDIPNLAVRANMGVIPATSVKFKADDVEIVVDDTAPFRLEYQDLLGLDPEILADDGLVRLMAEPYRETGGNGTPGTSLTVMVRINGL